MKFQLNDLSQYRKELMGLATIMIIVCHAPGSGVLMPPAIGRLLNEGNLGVDIFLFLSGIGCWFSLNKEKDRNRNSWGGHFIKRRFVRIFIPYFIIYIPFNIIYIFIGKYNVFDTILSLTTLEYWFYHRGAWFVSLIVLLYLLCPFISILFGGRLKLLCFISLIVAISLFAILPTSNGYNGIIFNVQRAIIRVPSFLLGILLGQMCKNKEMIDVKWIMMGFLFFLCVKFILPNNCLIFLSIPFITYILVLLCKILEGNCVYRILTFMGAISLESYLTNISLNNLLQTIVPQDSDATILYGRYLEYLIVIVGGVILACFVNKIALSLKKDFVSQK